MMNETMRPTGSTGCTCASKCACPSRRICWSAIIVGALVGTGLSFLLNLFSVAIGLALVKTTQDGMVTLAIGGFIGLLIGTIAAMFTGGYASGFLGRHFCHKRNHGALYGFTTWCVALILMVMFASHMTNYVAEYSDFITNPTPGVVVANNTAAPMVSQTNDATTVINAQKATNAAGVGGLFIFILFFVGALASCLGAHCGMGCCRDSNCCKE